MTKLTEPSPDGGRMPPGEGLYASYEVELAGAVVVVEVVVEPVEAPWPVGVAVDALGAVAVLVESLGVAVELTWPVADAPVDAEIDALGPVAGVVVAALGALAGVLGALAGVLGALAGTV